MFFLVFTVSNLQNWCSFLARPETQLFWELIMGRDHGFMVFLHPPSAAGKSCGYYIYIYVVYIYMVYIYKGFISTSILLHRQPFQSLSKGWGRCGCFRPGGSFHNQKLAVARLQWSYVLQNIAACIGKPQFTYIYISTSTQVLYVYVHIYMHTYTSYTHMYSVLAMCIHMIHIIYTSYNCVYSRN